MNNSYITIIKEKRTALSRKRVPLNQNECTADFRIGVPFEQNLQMTSFAYSSAFLFSSGCVGFGVGVAVGTGVFVGCGVTVGFSGVSVGSGAAIGVAVGAGFSGIVMLHPLVL